MRPSAHLELGRVSPRTVAGVRRVHLFRAERSRRITAIPASASWSGDGFRFDVSDERGHTAAVDEAPPLGTDAGFSPPDLLLGALCACTGITAVALLQKMKQPMRSLSVRADGDRQDDWPKAFTVIRLHFIIAGDGAFDEALVRKATELATKRYCAVGGTIELGSGGCQILFDHAIVPSAG